MARRSLVAIIAIVVLVVVLISIVTATLVFKGGSNKATTDETKGTGKDGEKIEGTGKDVAKKSVDYVKYKYRSRTKGEATPWLFVHASGEHAFMCSHISVGNPNPNRTVIRDKSEDPIKEHNIDNINGTNITGFVYRHYSDSKRAVILWRHDDDGSVAALTGDWRKSTENGHSCSPLKECSKTNWENTAVTFTDEGRMTFACSFVYDHVEMEKGCQDDGYSSAEVKKDVQKAGLYVCLQDVTHGRYTIVCRGGYMPLTLQDSGDHVYRINKRNSKITMTIADGMPNTLRASHVSSKRCETHTANFAKLPQQQPDGKDPFTIPDAVLNSKF